MLAVTWTGVVTAVVGLAAFCAAVGALSRLKPVKWLWRHLVTDPLSLWFDDRLDAKFAPIKVELSTNGGGSIKDAVIEMRESIARIDDRTDRADKRLDVVEATVPSLHDQLCELTTQIAELVVLHKAEPPKENP